MCVKYHERGEAMPVAVVYGWEPVMPFTACARFERNVSEYDVMGALRQKPVELVKCETNDLLVPATAEIVIEGVIDDPWESTTDGPFPELVHYGRGDKPCYIIRVTAITMR